MMARARGTRSDDQLRHGYGKTFEEAVEKALSPQFRRGEVGTGRAEVVFSEIIVKNPSLEYHVIVRFPTN